MQCSCMDCIKCVSDYYFVKIRSSYVGINGRKHN